MTFLPTPDGYVAPLPAVFLGQPLRIVIANDPLSTDPPTPPTPEDLALAERIAAHLDTLLPQAEAAIHSHLPAPPTVTSASIWIYILVREDEGPNRWTLEVIHGPTTNIEFDDLTYTEIWSDTKLS